MTDSDQRAFAESVFERNQRREAEINAALKQENARREAAVRNMYRLRALRLARDAKTIKHSSRTTTPGRLSKPQHESVQP
jgi:hypothetical protein